MNSETASDKQHIEMQERSGRGGHEGQSVLIVEDSIPEQLRLKAILQAQGYDVLTADDGVQALDVLQRVPVLLVISDWRMPGMTGLELCQHLRSDPVYGHPYVILVTGGDDKRDLVEGMDAGADDFIAKPYSTDELRVRLHAGMRIQRLRKDAEKRSAELAVALSKEAKTSKMLRKNLEAAAKLQRDILPDDQSPFDEVAIGGLFLPAELVAGDSFNYFPLDDQHMAFYLLDVAGHGVASAMLSFTVSRFLAPDLGVIELRHPEAGTGSSFETDAAAQLASPAEVVTALNAHFYENGDCTHYFTIVYGVINVDTGEGLLCQAGHPHPLIVTADHNVRQVGEGGFPVGMLKDVDYTNVSFHLQKGEQLVLYSDGVTDCLSPSDQPFGLERFIDLLHADVSDDLQQQLEAIGETLDDWNHAGSFEDDISVLILERRDDQAPAAQTQESDTLLALEVSPMADALPDAAEQVALVAAREGFAEQQQFELQVVVAEVLNNIVSYALSGMRESKIFIDVYRRENALEIRFIDHGSPMQDVPGDMLPDEVEVGGRGWAIIHGWTDRVSYEALDDRNVLILTKHHNPVVS